MVSANGAAETLMLRCGAEQAGWDTVFKIIDRKTEVEHDDVDAAAL